MGFLRCLVLKSFLLSSIMGSSVAYFRDPLVKPISVDKGKEEYKDPQKDPRLRRVYTKSEKEKLGIDAQTQFIGQDQGIVIGNFFIHGTDESYWGISIETFVYEEYDRDIPKIPLLKIEEKILWKLTTTFKNNSYAETYFNYSSNDQQPPTISQTNKPLFQRFFDKCGLTFESCESEFIVQNGKDGWANGWAFEYYDKKFRDYPDEVSKVVVFENTGDKKYTYNSWYLHRLAQNHTPQKIKDIKKGKVDYPYGSSFIITKPKEVSFWDKVKKTISSWF